MPTWFTSVNVPIFCFLRMFFFELPENSIPILEKNKRSAGQENAWEAMLCVCLSSIIWAGHAVFQQDLFCKAHP